MKKIFFSALLLAGFQSFGQSTKQISIAPTPRTGVTTKGITPLNESGLIPIQEGNTFTIAPNVSFAPRKHYFLRGALKSAGAFALSYQATKVINTGKNGTATSTNIAPAVGIGLGAGLPDMIKGLKHNKTYLTYSLYNNKQELVTTKSILLSRKTNGVTIDNANTDGYLKVAVIGSRAIAIPGEVNVDIAEPDYSGGIADNMTLDASGDCMGGGYIGGGGDSDNEDYSATPCAQCQSIYDTKIKLLPYIKDALAFPCAFLKPAGKILGCMAAAQAYVDLLQYLAGERLAICLKDCKK